MRSFWTTRRDSLALVVALERLGRAPLLQLAALLLSLCAWLAAYLPRELGLRSEPHCVLITRIALLAASLLSCAYALDHVPGGLYGDESVLGGVVRAHLDGTRPASPACCSMAWSTARSRLSEQRSAS